MPKFECQKCFGDWEKRWHRCIISEGDFLEWNNINIDEQVNTFLKNENSGYFYRYLVYSLQQKESKHTLLNKKDYCGIEERCVTNVTM